MHPVCSVYDSTFAFQVRGADGTTAKVRAYDVELLIRNASDGKNISMTL